MSELIIIFKISSQACSVRFFYLYSSTKLGKELSPRGAVQCGPPGARTDIHNLNLITFTSQCGLQNQQATYLNTACFSECFMCVSPGSPLRPQGSGPHLPPLPTMATVIGLERHRRTMSHQVPPPGTVSRLLSSTSLVLSGYHISQSMLSKNSLNNGVSGNLEWRLHRLLEASDAQPWRQNQCSPPLCAHPQSRSPWLPVLPCP